MQLELEEVNLLSESADMPLNETDKAWVREEISKSLELTGFAKFTNLLKGWLPLLIGAALVVFVLNEWSGYVQFRTNVGDRLDTIEKKDLPGIYTKLQNIEDRIQNLASSTDLIRLRELSTNPADPEKVQEAAQLLMNARQNKIQIDQDQVRKIGAKFLEAAKNKPANWTPALAFLSYCSFLNAFAAPAVPNAKPAAFTVEFSFKALRGIQPSDTGIAFLSSNDSVPISRAAKIERLGSRKHGRFPEATVGPTYIIMVVEGERAKTSHWEINLDSMLLKNAIVRNVRFSYQGGPLILNNVYFVDCFFDIQRTERGHKFAKSVLASAATNFQAKATTKVEQSALHVSYSTLITQN